MMALGREYTKRYGKEHLTITKCKEPLSKVPAGIPIKRFTQPPQAMPDEFKRDCAIHAYWLYYVYDKSHICNIQKEKLYDYEYIKNNFGYCDNIQRSASTN